MKILLCSLKRKLRIKFIKTVHCVGNKRLWVSGIFKDCFDVVVISIIIALWQRRQMKSLFNLQDKNTYRAREAYKRLRLFWGGLTARYIGETARNLQVRIVVHSSYARALWILLARLHSRRLNLFTTEQRILKRPLSFRQQLHFITLKVTCITKIFAKTFRTS